MEEIFGGNGLHNAFKVLNIEAKRTYKGSHEPYYEVWELDRKSLKALENVAEWPDEWGWWRSARGSNMGTACDFFTVNGHELIAWEGYSREDLKREWEGEPDEEKAEWHYSFKEYEEAMKSHEYGSLLEYMYDELGIGMESNICALAVDLARANGMTMGKLFQVYEG